MSLERIIAVFLFCVYTTYAEHTSIVTQATQAKNVEIGSYFYYDASYCANSTFCYANNWATAYVAYGFFPETQDYEFGTFHLNANQALVVEFEIPPSCLYFAMTPYLLNRTYTSETSADYNLDVFASLMDTANMYDIEKECGPNYNGTIRFIMSPNLYVTQKMTPSWHTCVIPFNIAGSLLNLGYDDTNDWFALLGRFTVFDNEREGQHYLHEATTTVERITLEVETEFFGYPELDKRPDMINEAYLSPLLENLEQAVGETMKQAGFHWKKGYSLVPFMQNISYDSGWSGINNSQPLLGDNRDASYFNSPPNSEWLLHPDDFILVLGVLHSTVVKATYNNFQIYDWVNYFGVTGYMNVQMEGSATQFLPHAEDLYVLAFSRNCSALPYVGPCASISETFPNGIPLTHPVFFVERIYSCPDNWRGPDPTTILPTQVYYFSNN